VADAAKAALTAAPGWALAGALLVAGCSTLPGGGVARPKDSCRAEPGQRFLGERASAESGAAIMAATRSTSLRWIPPDTIVTTEYAFGRVTVSYDGDYRIMQVTCG